MVEADECHEQPHVSLGECVTQQVSPAGQHGLTTVQRTEQLPANLCVK